jgi:alpha-1,3-fucosyltransferase 10
MAFENIPLEDYVSEKLGHAFITTSLPIYHGAPNIDDFLPSVDPQYPSVIKANDFESPKHLAEHLKYLISNETAYEEYFKWKQLPRNQIQVPKSIKPRTCKYCDVSWACRICLRIHNLL